MPPSLGDSVDTQRASVGQLLHAQATALVLILPCPLGTGGTMAHKNSVTP